MIVLLPAQHSSSPAWAPAISLHLEFFYILGGAVQSWLASETSETSQTHPEAFSEKETWASRKCEIKSMLKTSLSPVAEYLEYIVNQQFLIKRIQNFWAKCQWQRILGLHWRIKFLPSSRTLDAAEPVAKEPEYTHKEREKFDIFQYAKCLGV